LGGELKPSLDVVVTAPIDSGRSFPAGPPVRWSPSLTVEGIAGSAPPETLRRGLTEVAFNASDGTGHDGDGPARAASGGSEGSDTSIRIRKRRPKSGGTTQ
jgi:hypothetical protein